MRGQITEVVKFQRSIAAQAFTDDAVLTGTAMLVRDGESLAVLLDLSELGGANGTVDLKLQTAPNTIVAGVDTEGAYTDITGAAITQITDASGDNGFKVCHLNCNSPLVNAWVRPVVTVAGDTPTGTLSVALALGRNSETPVTQTLGFNV